MNGILIAESILPHVNASLNALAFVLLCIGYGFIRAGNEKAHKWAMLSSFVVSTIFLACYLQYHYGGYGHTTFDRDSYPSVAIFYYLLLASHIILAALVPFLVLTTIFLALTDRRKWHRRIARWTLPIWMYVSVTGVLVYFMIYWWFPPIAESQV